MKSTASPPRSTGFLEPLEARIAPAVIFIGAGEFSETARDTEYREGFDDRPAGTNLISFVDTSADQSTDPIAAAVDTNAGPMDARNTFFLRLSAGDEVQAFAEGSNYQRLIRVSAGQAIAFFTDLNGDNEYNEGELTGFSLGKNARVEVAGPVAGDVVTNLDEGGTSSKADDRIDMSGVVSNLQGIGSFRATSVSGSILSGGSIAFLDLKDADNVLAGSATNGATFSFFLADTGKGTISTATVSGQAGASISNVSVGEIDGRIEAGAGGVGAVGGSLSKISVFSDTTGVALLAGNGGNSDGIKKLNGGAGGNLTDVFVYSTIPDLTSNTDVPPGAPAPPGVVMRAGSGGDATDAGTGGAGGRVTTVGVGFDNTSRGPLPTSDLLADNVDISSGTGGDGKRGGVGGAISGVSVRVQTADFGTTEVQEIKVIAGTGGTTLAAAGGVAGAGGSISKISLFNGVTTANADIRVEAGDAGLASNGSLGAIGGSISGAKLLGFDLSLVAGDGSSGKTGGAGGSILNVEVFSGTGDIGAAGTVTVGAGQNDSILARNLLVSAGTGGSGLSGTGNGGAGGNITGFRVQQSDFEQIRFNSPTTGGDGGNSVGGTGGRGGSISKVDVTDKDSAATITGIFDMRAGEGGNGSKGGGAGGALTSVVLTGLDLAVEARSGDGGTATLLGKGGAGGSVTSVTLVSDQVSVLPVDGRILSSATLSAGDGGNGAGRGGSGGLGGSITGSSSLIVGGSATVTAGDGGLGSLTVGTVKGGAAGSGGSIVTSGVFAITGFGTLTAGDAGTQGISAGKGGSVLGSASTTAGLRAAQDLTVTAGDGSFGGAGGSIRDLTFGSANIRDIDGDGNILTPTPNGNITVIAGAGSALGKVGGAGGSIERVTGSLSQGVGKTVEIRAGDGGGDAGAVLVSKAGAGGSINRLDLSQGGGEGVLLTIKAGDAGTASTGKTGAKGGDVRAVTLATIDLDTTIRSIAAGDGGAASNVNGRGGLGGSIVGVFARDYDLGIRSGQEFGYDTQGGLFAGASGKAATDGLAGNVSIVEARAIASIVAGRTLVPEMVEKVDRVTLSGEQGTALLVSNGSFIPNGEFVLSFGGAQTTLLPGNATGAEVQAALNNLSTIAAVGGVTVTVNADQGYRIAFINPGDRSQITGVEQLQQQVIEVTQGANALVVVEENQIGQLPFTSNEVTSGDLNTVPVVESIPGTSTFRSLEIVPGNTQNQTQETQSLALDYLADFPTGQFTLTVFTNPAPPANPVRVTTGPLVLAATEVETARNIQTAINAILNPDSVLVRPIGSDNIDNNFEIIFGRPGERPAIDGLFTVPEQQKFTLPQALIRSTDGEFQITFQNGVGGEDFTTIKLPANASAAEIEAALNELPSVAQAGGATVERVGSQVTVDFGDIGNRSALRISSFVPEVQSIDLTEIRSLNGSQFTLEFQGQRTVAIDGDANAVTIRNALNALGTVTAAGGVTVTSEPGDVIVITFGNTGDQPPITGIAQAGEVQTINIGDVADASSGEFSLDFTDTLTIVESVDGTRPLSIIEVRSGSFGLNTDEIRKGDNDPAVREIQRVNTGPTVEFGAANGRFTLTFNGDTTPQLASNSTAAQVQTALNNLNSIKELQRNGTGTAIGAVTVAGSALGTSSAAYDITFPGAVDLTSQVIGIAIVPEKQQLALGNFVSSNGTFTLTFNGRTTGPLAGSANASQIAAALNTAAGSTIVTVADLGQGTFDISFIAPGERTAITGAGVSSEQQTINLANLGNLANGQFILSFGGASTPALPAGATTAAIQNALNALPTIAAVGSVTVAQGSVPGTVVVNFNTVGDKADITGTAFGEVPAINTTLQGTNQVLVATTTTPGTAAVAEKQSVTLDPARSSFTLSFNGFTTQVLATNATEAQIEAALGGLPSVAAAGGIDVVRSGDNLAINFNRVGDQAQVTGLANVVAETQTLNLGVLAGLANGKFAVTFNGQQTSSITIAGSNSTQIASDLEQALNALASVKATAPNNSGTVDVVAGPSGDFTIQFAGGGNQSELIGQARLTRDASAAEVEAVLDALVPGGVTVVAGAGAEVADGAFKVTFNELGNQPAIVSRGFTNEFQRVDVFDEGNFALTFNLETVLIQNSAAAPASAQTVEDALNGLSTIQNAGGVDVTANLDSSYNIVFRRSGDQPPLIAVQFETMPAFETRKGVGIQPEIQQVNYFQKRAFELASFREASLVGAIADINERDASVFHFIRDGVRITAAQADFRLGDTPIDGIVMARFFETVKNGASVNFTPEASLINGVFFDNNNSDNRA